MLMSYVWIGLWGAFYLLGFFIDTVPILANKGITIIGIEYYRFFTGLLLHVNLIHFLANAIAIYYVGRFLKDQVSGFKLLAFSFIAGILTSAAFAFWATECISIGGSPVVFALFGLMIYHQVTKKATKSFKWNTGYGKWIIGYVIIGNIPWFSKNISTLVIHIIALCIGGILAVLTRGMIDKSDAE